MEFLVIMFFLDFKHTINTNLSRLQKKETVKVKFHFDLSLVKQCFQQQYDLDDEEYYYTDDQPADDPRKTSSTMDNKNLFDWTARVKLDGLVGYYLDLIIECPTNAAVVKAKLFKMKGFQRTEISLELSQDVSNVLIAKRVCDINESLPLEFDFEAHFYIHNCLESMLNMSESVAGLFENGKYTDLILSVKNEKFRCHKAMLMEKSPVFEAMVTQK
jgi:hypothetical protein